MWNRKRKKITAKGIRRQRQKLKRKLAKNKTPRKASELFFVTEPALFDNAEGTFVNYNSRKRVKVYLVPASWSRVIMISLIYAFILSLIKYTYFGFFGRPQWVPSPSLEKSVSNPTNSEVVAVKDSHQKVC